MLHNKGKAFSLMSSGRLKMAGEDNSITDSIIFVFTIIIAPL
jgi:hypothetical protein